MALTQAQERFLEAASEAARELDANEIGSRGRELTSLIGKLVACQKMDLMWEPSDGYDAREGERRFQIKTRKSWTTPNVNRTGRLGIFRRKKGYGFDVGLYVELDGEFDVVGIWEMEVTRIKALEDVESGGRALHVGTFVREAKPVFVSQAEHL